MNNSLFWLHALFRRKLKIYLNLENNTCRQFSRAGILVSRGIRARRVWAGGQVARIVAGLTNRVSVTC